MLTIWFKSQGSIYLPEEVPLDPYNNTGIEEGSIAFKILTSKPEGNKPLSRPRPRQDSIRMDLKEIGISMKNWIDSARIGIIAKFF